MESAASGAVRPGTGWRVEWATGGLIGGAMGAVPGHADVVRSVTTATVEGRPVAVTGGDDEVALVWDLARGERVGDPLAARGSVWTVASTVVAGRPVVVVADPHARVQAWDLTGCRLLAGRAGGAWAATTVRVNGHAVVLTGGEAPGLRMWDPATGEPLGDLAGDSSLGRVGAVVAVATALVEGRAKAFTLHDDSGVHVWDLTEHRHEGRVLLPTGGGQRVSLTVAVVDGRPVAVTGDWDGRVQVWDVDTRTELAGRGRPTPHTGPVWALAAAVVDDRPLVVTGGDDRTVRVWDLASHRPVGSASVFPCEVTAVAMAPDGRVVVGCGGDVTVLAPLTT